MEIEDVSPLHETLIVRIEEQVELKKVEQSITYEQQMYRVGGIPWKCNEPALPNNYKMAIQRRQHTTNASNGITKRDMLQKYQKIKVVSTSFSRAEARQGYYKDKNSVRCSSKV